MSSERTEALEVRVAWLERHVAELDEVVRGAVERLDELRRAIETLEEAQSGRGPGTPEDEAPPHY
jgi:uncharacterized coiled-coil protein SlyX